jgi:glucosamine-6-phosphate deaminase
MESNFFKHIDLPTWNRHLLDGVARYPELECEAYELKIRAQGGINLWFLGIGGNGHIAFNEPGSAVNSRTRIVSLTQETIEANSDGRFFSNPDEVPRCALSVGIGAIREADQIIVLALGEKKSQAVANAIQGPFDPSCPASLLQDHPNVTYYLDEPAASKLNK